MNNLDAGVDARVLSTTLSAHLYLIACDSLSFLLKNPHDVCARAAAERDQHKLHRSGRGKLVVRKARQYRVAARRFADECLISCVPEASDLQL
jgi:hypothetical protein